MPHPPPIWLAVLWSAWVVQSLLSVLLVWKFSHRFGREPRRRDAYQPPAVVIVPFKGVDEDLEAGVRSLLEQQYPDYRLLLVVDSPDDPARPVLQRVAAAYPQRHAEILVSGLAAPTQGQKTHNQVFALDHLARQPWKEQVQALVFADSDAIPGPDWLAAIIAPLKQARKTGMTTGYRWLVPITRSGGDASIWSHFASVINSSVACLFGKDAFAHAWGGSMAIRADTAQRGGLRDRLVGAITDDYQLTRMCKDLKLRVYFVPRCLVATPVSFTRDSLFNFGHRQYLITRVYAPWLWLSALVVTSLYVAGFASAWLALGHFLYHDFSGHIWVWPLAAMAVVLGANQVRASLRRRVVRLALGDESLRQLRKTLTIDRWLTPLWMGLHLLFVLRGGLGRTMRWRGIDYRLDGPQKIERLTR